MQIFSFPGIFQTDSRAWRKLSRLPALALAGTACISPAFASPPCPTPLDMKPGRVIVQPAAGGSGFSDTYSKSAAILQGSVSRLDQIRMQQAENSKSPRLPQPASGAIVRPHAFAALSSLLRPPFARSDAIGLQLIERSAPSLIKSEYAAASLPQLSTPDSWINGGVGKRDNFSPALLDAALPDYEVALFTEPPAVDCLNASAPSYADMRNAAGHIRVGQPDVFGTVALRVSRTALDGKWRSASRATLTGRGGPWAAVVAQNRNLPRATQIRNVNAWVNQRISYVEDVRQYGAADHWSSAVQSLTRGRGDCEDYAIAKMQILRALGVAADSMFLVIARDLVRRADHAILAVAVDGDLVVLDNETDRILSSADARDYRPILSFNTSGSWTHGYRTAPPAAALRYASLDR